MSGEEIRKLVGGYATGTLTPEEREALFRAALEDQELFDTLAREQALHDLLGDSSAKAQVLAALDEPTPRWSLRMLWLRPAAVALAMAGIATLAVISWRQRVAAPMASPMASFRPAPPPMPSGTPQTEADAAPSPKAAPPASGSPAAEGRKPIQKALPPPTAAPGSGNQPVGLTAPQLLAAGGGGGGPRPATMARMASPAPGPMAAPPPPPPPAPAQAPAGILAGTVTDPSGAAIGNATITVGSATGNQVVNGQARTDSSGNWSIDTLRPGQYEVTVAAPGFKTERAGVELQPPAAKKLETRLDVGNSTEAVQVTAGAAAIAGFRDTNDAPSQAQQQAAPQAAQESLREALARGGVAGGAVGGMGGNALSRPGAHQLYDEAAAIPANGVIPTATRSGALPTFRAQLEPAFGLRYSLLPSNNGAVQIAITAAADGYLTVAGPTGAVLFTLHAERLKSLVTPPLALTEKQVAVVFSRQPPRPIAKEEAVAKDVLAAQSAPVRPLEETVAGVTYVAARTAGPLSFRIDLK